MSKNRLFSKTVLFFSSGKNASRSPIFKFRIYKEFGIGRLLGRLGFIWPQNLKIDEKHVKYSVFENPKFENRGT